jgi:hypothetical protein
MNITTPRRQLATPIQGGGGEGSADLPGHAPNDNDVIEREQQVQRQRRCIVRPCHDGEDDDEDEDSEGRGIAAVIRRTIVVANGNAMAASGLTSSGRHRHVPFPPPGLPPR